MKQLDIIIPSFRDSRILITIESIRRFDDADLIRLIIIDGGSDNLLLENIKKNLTSDDILIAEPDNGIFDALNKGLRASQSEFIGWLGSDDIFTTEMNASSIIKSLENTDLFVARTIHAVGQNIIRVTKSWPIKKGLIKYGLNNSHFSTFGRRSVFTSVEFDSAHPAADIDYFLEIFSAGYSVKTSNKITTVMQAFGTSNASLKSILKTNLILFSIYKKRSNSFIAALCLFNKLSLKLLSALRYKIFPKKLDDPLLKKFEL